MGIEDELLVLGDVVIDEYSSSMEYDGLSIIIE
jgi:hypothetical protein